MSMERRLLLFFVFAALFMWGMPLVLQRVGLLPEPPAQQPVAAARKAADDQPPATTTTEPDEASAPDAVEEGPAATAAAAPTPRPEVVPVDPAKLVMGSVDPESPFLLEAQFAQVGAGLATLRSSRIEAEIQEGQPRDRPLTFVSIDPKAAVNRWPSFGLNLLPEAAVNDDPTSAPAGRLKLDDVAWEVVLDDQERAVRPVERKLATGAEESGQEIRFRTTTQTSPQGIEVTKIFRLWPGQNGLELTIELASSDESAPRVAYELKGPRGLPIEGEWFTGTFRDVFIGGATTSGDQIITKSAYDVVKNRDDPERVTNLPIKYAGVENQYFAVFLQPQPTPQTLEQSVLAEARGIVVTENEEQPQKSDVSVQLLSRELRPAPNHTIRHEYRIFAGPKTAEALAAVDAFELSTFRKGWHLPLIGDMGAQFMAKNVIAPMLTRTYAATAWVSQLFGGSRGSYGIAIIMLTVLVRIVLFPLGRKQARAAQKMQELQPLIAKLKEKYGDDKERITRETFALYKANGANPMAGCLPALVQLPVLVGLWQALNNSVALRHSRFLWIDNLAAPDMLFKFPSAIPSLPLIGSWLGPYFNVLPFFVVGLMLVQTKLFSPPPTTPEAEQQQKMMKFMMIFMAFLFYKVPSGLGIYFITSSLWQIGERLLLPKGKPIEASLDSDEADKKRTASAPSRPEPSTRPGANSSKPAPKPAEAPGGFWAEVRAKARERMEQVMEDAQKQRTVRNADTSGNKGGAGKGGSKERNRPRSPERKNPRKP